MASITETTGWMNRRKIRSVYIKVAAKNIFCIQCHVTLTMPI